ncbi:MAG: glycosyltransferase, partial [Planctomycetota bacterium]
MRITLIGPTYPFRGGIAHYTTLLFRELRKRHEVQLLSFRRQYPSWLFPGRSDRDGSGLVMEEPGAIPVLDSMNPVTWVEMFRRAREFRPEAVIVSWWVSFWAPQFLTITWLLDRLGGANVLYICHNVVAHEDSALSRALTKAALATGRGFIVHSAQDEANLRRMFPGRAIRH